MTDLDNAIYRLRRIIEIIRAGVGEPETREFGITGQRFEWDAGDVGFFADLIFDSRYRRYELHVHTDVHAERLSCTSSELGELLAQRYLTNEQKAAHLALAIEERSS